MAGDSRAQREARACSRRLVFVSPTRPAAEVMWWSPSLLGCRRLVLTELWEATYAQSHVFRARCRHDQLSMLTVGWRQAYAPIGRG